MSKINIGHCVGTFRTEAREWCTVHDQLHALCAKDAEIASLKVELKDWKDRAYETGQGMTELKQRAEKAEAVVEAARIATKKVTWQEQMNLVDAIAAFDQSRSKEIK